MRRCYLHLRWYFLSVITLECLGKSIKQRFPLRQMERQQSKTLHTPNNSNSLSSGDIRDAEEVFLRNILVPEPQAEVQEVPRRADEVLKNCPDLIQL